MGLRYFDCRGLAETTRHTCWPLAGVGPSVIRLSQSKAIERSWTPWRAATVAAAAAALPSPLLGGARWCWRRCTSPPNGTSGSHPNGSAVPGAPEIQLRRLYNAHLGPYRTSKSISGGGESYILVATSVIRLDDCPESHRSYSEEANTSAVLAHKLATN